MEMTAWEVPDADLSAWVPGTRFFATNDDKYFVIDADLTEVPGWITTVIRRRTAVFYCTSNAGVTDLDADFEYPEGTTPEQAVKAMGYTLVEQPSDYQVPMFSTPVTPDEGATA
jgi:hypothetical protein